MKQRTNCPRDHQVVQCHLYGAVLFQTSKSFLLSPSFDLYFSLLFNWPYSRVSICFINISTYLPSLDLVPRFVAGVSICRCCGGWQGTKVSWSMDWHVWPADPWRVFTQNWHKPRHAFPRWSADKQYLASPTPQIQFLHPTSILGHAAASTPLHRESMEMQGYCIVGTHSGFALKKQPGLVIPSWSWEKGGKASLLPGA